MVPAKLYDTMSLAHSLEEQRKPPTCVAPWSCWKTEAKWSIHLSGTQQLLVQLT